MSFFPVITSKVGSWPYPHRLERTNTSAYLLGLQRKKFLIIKDSCIEHIKNIKNFYFYLKFFYDKPTRQVGQELLQKKIFFKDTNCLNWFYIHKAANIEYRDT